MSLSSVPRIVRVSFITSKISKVLKVPTQGILDDKATVSTDDGQVGPPIQSLPAVLVRAKGRKRRTASRQGTVPPGVGQGRGVSPRQGSEGRREEKEERRHVDTPPMTVP